jgi:selenocysteine lyase/cysteine desulfurase
MSKKVSAALKRQGAVFLIDATHHVGLLDLDVTRLDPDFVMFRTYKWLIGPYGRAVLHVAKRATRTAFPWNRRRRAPRGSSRR